jgi:hypothetical protein
VDAFPKAGAEVGCTILYQTCNSDFCRPPERRNLAIAVAHKASG